MVEKAIWLDIARVCVSIFTSRMYSIFVDELLDLTNSKLGVTVDTIYCGAPMYGDDLAL